MTSHLNRHRTTDIKMEVLSGVQTGNGIQHVEDNIRGIAHVHAYRKDDIFVCLVSFAIFLSWVRLVCLFEQRRQSEHKLAIQ